MLRYIYGNDLTKYPTLRDTMFRDRAEQFAQRLNWDVTVNNLGHERDEYDDLNPLYVIWVTENGTHGGSIRFMPTIGRTMISDHFANLTSGVRIESPLIWECTRFCLSPDAGRRNSAALVLGAGEVMEAFYLSHFVGVFDPSMERIYRSLGVEPDVIGQRGDGDNKVGVGLWEMKEAAWPRILHKVGVSRAQSRAWFNDSISQKGAPKILEPNYA